MQIWNIRFKFHRKYRGAVGAGIPPCRYASLQRWQSGAEITAGFHHPVLPQPLSVPPGKSGQSLLFGFFFFWRGFTEQYFNYKPTLESTLRRGLCKATTQECSTASQPEVTTWLTTTPCLGRCQHSTGVVLPQAVLMYFSRAKQEFGSQIFPFQDLTTFSKCPRTRFWKAFKHMQSFPMCSSLPDFWTFRQTPALV